MKELDIYKGYYLGNLTKDQRRELFIKNFQNEESWGNVTVEEFVSDEGGYLEFDVLFQEWDWVDFLDDNCKEVDARELFEEEEKVAPNLVPLFDAVEMLKDLKEETEEVVEKSGVKDSLAEKIKELKSFLEEYGLEVEFKIK